MKEKLTKIQQLKKKYLGVNKEKQSEVGWIHVRERNGKYMINVLEISDALKDISNRLSELETGKVGTLGRSGTIGFGIILGGVI